MPRFAGALLALLAMLGPAALGHAASPVTADPPLATHSPEAAVCEPGVVSPAVAVPEPASPEAFVQANRVREAIEAGQLEGAALSLDEALALGAALPDRDRIRLRIHVARSFARLADVEADPEASAAALRAAALLNDAAGDAAEAGEIRLESFALGYLGQLYEGRGRHDEALTLTRRALLLADRAQAGDALYLWQWQIGRGLAAKGDRPAAIEAYRRAVTQLDALRADLAQTSLDSALAFRAQVEPVYLELVDLLLTQAAALDVQGTEREQALLAEVRDRLESLKVAELRDYFQDTCLIAQRRAAAEDVPGAVVLYPVVLPDRVELILSTRSGLSRHAAGVDGETLEAEARQLRRLLAKRSTKQFIRPAQHLYDWLIRPIEAAFAEEPEATLVVIPSGSLRTIPFAALHDAKTDRYLIEMIPIAVTPGLTLTDPRPIDPKRAQSLVAALTESVQGFPALENAGPEAEHVSEAFPGVVLIDEAFTVERFETELGRRAVSVVHIASHGEFNGDPAQSFVLTHDGKIPMDALGGVIGQTRLRTEEPLELLVLSACQTAAGDERAALGLAGIALSAGARSALATLWSVDDAATARLIETFYSALASGDSRARALQRAQNELARDPSFAHPFYWAPYMLINSWL